MKTKYILVLAIVLGMSSCEDYLDRKNLDTLDDSNFWTSESNMRLYAQGAYTNYFYGYGTGFSYGSFFTFGPWADEYSSSSIWQQNTATSGNGWSFTNVRRANLMINRVDLLPVADEAKNHWRGIGRFFRAMEYFSLTKLFGAVPYYDTEIFPADVDLSYKERDPMPLVSEKILEDYEYAAANVRLNDGVQQINRDVVLAFMSRHLLYLGTYMKYHDVDQTAATKMLEKAKWAAQQLMESGKYQVADDYRAIFSSEDLSNNPEVIFYRQYADGRAMHSLVSYNNQEAQTGTTLKMFETYLASDGLPIKQSPAYDYASDNGLRLYADQYDNRDPRLAATLVDTIKVWGTPVIHSTTGIATWKFLPYNAGSEQKNTGSNNVTDAPVIRFGEVLLNYAEAAAELGTFSQDDANATINKLRNRSIRKNNQGSILDKLPPMEVAGTDVIANGTIIDDPDRDPTVSSLLWEIRRERAVELIYEGFRKDDLRRWKKFEYLRTVEDNDVPTKLAIGAYIDLSVYNAEDRAKVLQFNQFYYPDENDTDRAFIYTLYDANMRRDWQPGAPYYERQYLNAIPLDQIKLYKDLGYSLTQNPGWDGVN